MKHEVCLLQTTKDAESKNLKQVSFKKEVGVRVN